MNYKNIGCVYFFKHEKLSPIKIGYTNKDTPKKRYESFKTYCPYNALIVGFIKTKNAKELEYFLHEKFKDKRLKGEWFDISVDDVENCINLYSSDDFINSRNEFYLKFIENELPSNKLKNETSQEFIDFLDFYDLIKGVKYDKKQLYDIFNNDLVSRKKFSEWLEKYAHYNNFKVLKGKSNKLRWIKFI